MDVINPKTEEELIQEFKDQFLGEVRAERNKRIAETDYIYLPDVIVSDEYKAQVNAYRQELRDVPAVAENWLADKDIYSVSVWGVPWPEKP